MGTDLCFFFFFQAEDGIRDLTVTGVQTCALPISRGRVSSVGMRMTRGRALNAGDGYGAQQTAVVNEALVRGRFGERDAVGAQEIGRASCRERVEIWGVAVALKRERQRM